MCAPASVTALHQVLTVSMVHAYLTSQLLGLIGVVASLGIGALKAFKAKLPF